MLIATPTNTLVKDRKMGGSWIIIDVNQQTKLENVLYYKDWSNNTTISAKVIVLLKLVEVIERKGQNIESRAIVITVDNRKAYRDLLYEIIKSN